MRESIAYCVDWEKNRERTWSGTPWSLYNALARRVNVVDCPLDSGSALLRHVTNKFRSMFGAGDMNLSAMNRIDRRFRTGQRACLPDVLLQFGESPRPKGSERHYVYQDLCVEWLRQASIENPEVFAWSGFSGQSLHALERAAASQAEFYEKAAGVFCMGHWFADYLVMHCGLPQEKVHWVGAGCNAKPEPETSWHRKEDTFLFVGRDFKRKGGRDLITASPRVRERIPEAKLIIVGPTKRDKPTVEGVTWLGDLPNSELPELFSRVDAFVMPSHFEAYGIVFLEAASSGLPIVARNAFEMPYFVEHGKNGLLVGRESDASELADAMVAVLREPRFRQEAVNRMPNVCAEYSWDAVAERIISVIAADTIAISTNLDK